METLLVREREISGQGCMMWSLEAAVAGVDTTGLAAREDRGVTRC